MSAVEIVFVAIQLIATFSTISNEVCLLLSQWIISPSKPPNARFEAIFPSIVTTALAYAVAEPLAYTALLLLPVPPSLVMISMSHICPLVSSFAQDQLSIELYLEVASQRKASEDNAKSAAESKAEPTSNPNFKGSPPPASRAKVTCALLAQTVIAAVFNAALSLFSESLAATSLEPDASAWGYIILWSTGLFCYLATTVLSFPGNSFRARFIGSAGLWILRAQLYHLALLLACRAVARKLLGIQPFLGFIATDQRVVDELVERETYSGFVKLREYVPVWWYSIADLLSASRWGLLFAQLVIGPACVVSGYSILRSVQRDRLQPYRDLARGYSEAPDEAPHA